MDIEIKKFDMTKLADAGNIFIIGRRCTGKTTIAIDILYHKRHFSIGKVITCIESEKEKYKQSVPSILIHDEYHPEIPKHVIKLQKTIIQKKYDEIKSFFVADSCILNSLKDEYLTNLLYNAKSLNILNIITMGYALGFSPFNIKNANYVFITQESCMREREHIYRLYGKLFPSFEMFNSIMMQICKGYICMVIDNTIMSNKLEDRIFWYKANIHPEFTICEAICKINREPVSCRVRLI